MAVVVVRYFGGTLLGVPGLINAYKTSASLALQLTPIIQKPVLTKYEMEFDYTLLNDIMMLVKKFDCELFTNEMQLFCRMVIGVPKNKEDECLQKLRNIHSLHIKIHKNFPGS